MRVILILIFVFNVLCGRSQSFTLNGNSSNLGGGCYRLTTSSSFQVGSVWCQDVIDLSLPFNVRCDVKFGNSDGG
ncbi:MAG: lectin-like domain-containing protein, partial [Flavobacteriales bacterium]